MSTSDKSAKKATVKKVEPLIYCGPNLKNGLLSRYTVFQNGIPDYITKDIEACPVIKNLFVEIKQFIEVENKIAILGTAENAWFNEVKNYTKVV